MDKTSQPGADDPSLTPLILGHLDGRLADAEFESLEQRLASDPAARAQYVRLARLDAELREDVAGCESLPQVAVPKPVTFFSPSRRMLAVAAGIGLLAGLSVLMLRDEPHPDQPDLVTRGVAVISAEAGAVWERAKGPAFAVGVALAPGRLVLREGLAQIDFYGGASVSLSGPAELELIGPDEAVLHRGRLRADVPPAARGFEVRTADVRIVDLGTSFGLATADDDSAEVVVFDGEVRAIGSDGAPVPLYGGDAAKLAKGSASPQEKRPLGSFPSFAQIVAGAGDRSESRYAAWKQASADRRRDSRLVAYYDFEGLTEVTRRLENRATTGGGSELDGGIVGARVAQGRWAQKTALDFRREGDRVRFNIPGEFPTLTLYAWVRIDALDRNLNSLFLTDYFDPNEIHWQVSRNGTLHFATSPMGAVDIDTHNRRFYSETFWEPGMSGKWTMLAVTADRGDGTKPGTVVHYVDGRALRMESGTQMHKPLPKMRIGQADLGNWSDPIWTYAIRTLNGRIDEFAIYQAALSAAEIQQIYQQGKP
ncbi:MAG: LamG-like jellyroll fold domain-containing protein [Prosthecobacter sp.]